MASTARRDALRGAEVGTLDLIFEVLSSDQWAELLAALLARAADMGYEELEHRLGDAGALHEADVRGHGEIANELQQPMADVNGREALRGAEADSFDLMFEVLTPQQWAEWLAAPLERAAAKGNRDLAQQLVRAGAEIGDALHEAVRGGHGEIVSDLLESGASSAAKDTRGRTPLHVAARRGKPEMVQLLLANGADTEAFDDRQWTPLYVVTYHGHVDAARALLAAGADISLGRGPLEFPAIIAAALFGRVEILGALIQHGADVEAVNRRLNTALHFAALKNNIEVINVLVDAGANIEARDHLGHTPLHYASHYLSREALLCLLRHNATVNAQTNGTLNTPLMCAVKRAGTQGVTEVVGILLRAGANETMVDDSGAKAWDMVGEDVLGEMRSAGDVELVRQLLANAPGDRAWRRRGYLVLCRAHPARMQQNVVTSTHHGDAATTEISGCQETLGGSNVEEIQGGGWAVVAAKVLRLQEEGMFRTIVGYL